MSPQVIRVCKHLGGWFVDSCYHYLLKHPAVADVAALYGWRADGCLTRGELNRPQRLAVEAFARGVAAARADQLEEGRKNAKG